MFLLSSELFSLGSFYRANACASAAIETCVSIDNVLAVLFRDSLNRTFRSASTAADAIVSNLVCHWKYTSVKIV